MTGSGQVRAQEQAAGMPAGAVQTGERLSGGKRHYSEVDIARGIGIILVVLGHALKQAETGSAGVALAIQVIYSFHMPLFFILSGFVSAKLPDLPWAARPGFIRDRALRLLIPYCFISALYIPLKVAMSAVAVKPYELSSAWRILIGDSPNTTMWFLYALFLSQAVAALLVTRRSLPWVCAGAFILAAAAAAFGWTWKFPNFFIYYLLGLLLRQHYDTIAAYFRPKAGLIMAVLFVGINAASWCLERDLAFPAAAVSGSFLVLYLSWALRNGEGRAVRTLQEAGRISMDIYVLSDPVMTVTRLALGNILHLGAGMVILMCFLTGLFVSAGAGKWIVRKIWILRLLLLGERRRG